ncbi:hypothetical protein K504DRAFT_491973 [Pleomassaria siparia CBS 279.74]|uniref:Uncharacterized protein n=1 Tax=Pleomassaria siparia CBS 279.74 TaxID=1314801 RepID=A0A6G1K6A1_9PLEO|nr:hypothetical protein K504DRAFT_491973 [Pleomassaria siparia CBS 279.74]
MCCKRYYTISLVNDDDDDDDDDREQVIKGGKPRALRLARGSPPDEPLEAPGLYPASVNQVLAGVLARWPCMSGSASPRRPEPLFRGCQRVSPGAWAWVLGDLGAWVLGVLGVLGSSWAGEHGQYWLHRRQTGMASWRVNPYPYPALSNTSNVFQSSPVHVYVHMYICSSSSTGVKHVYCLHGRRLADRRRDVVVVATTPQEQPSLNL